MARISVLSQLEVKEFDEPPVFDSIDRKRFYDLTGTLQSALNTLRTPQNRVLFLVSYAYFKARKRFYDGHIHKKDLMYAAATLGFDLQSLDTSYPQRTRLNHQTMILEIFGYKAFNGYDQEELANHIYLQVKSYQSPRLIFAGMVEYLLGTVS